MNWNIDSAALFYIVLISVSVGFFAALLVFSLMRRSHSLEPPRKDLIELAHLWRDKVDGRLWLQIDEQSGTELGGFEGDSQEKARKIAGELAAWVGSPVTPAAASILSKIQRAETTPPPANPDFPATMTGSTQTTQDDLAYSAGVETGLPAETGNAERPRIDIVKGIRLTMEGNLNKAAADPSIAAQVDVILQEKLKGTVLEKRGIRLMELPGKGMVVMIGLDQYDTVEDVPFPEIKMVLKSAVADWERKMLG
jgi:hypothetical protein